MAHRLVTLAADVTATAGCFRITGDVSDIQPHARFRIGNELVDLYGFDRFPNVAGYRSPGVDKTRWLVQRGVGESKAEPHFAGATLMSAVAASVSSTDIEPPAPFASDITFEGEIATSYSTASAQTGVTTTNPAGGVASLTHDSPSNLPPYITVRVWERTA